MLQPSVTWDQGDLEARRRVELVDAPGLDDVRSHRGFPRSSSRLPIEYRTLSIHVESRIPEETRGGAKIEKRKAAARGRVQCHCRMPFACMLMRFDFEQSSRFWNGTSSRSTRSLHVWPFLQRLV
jgi:hypothetical protein